MGAALIRAKRKQRRGGGIASTAAAAYGGAEPDTNCDQGAVVLATSADIVSARQRAAASALTRGSITHESDLDHLLNEAVMAGERFEAEKEFKVIFAKNAFNIAQVKTPDQLAAQRATFKLGVPRRPTWNEHTSPEELATAEGRAFVDWRRELAHIEEEERLLLTPFEKNLDIWRQLWRVVERSDALAQIVDARDPLFFMCEDLAHYVKETGKHKLNMLIVNKADYLSEEQRIYWARYFVSQDISFMFFSALEGLLNSEKEKEAEASAALAKEQPAATPKAVTKEGIPETKPAEETKSQEQPAKDEMTAEAKAETEAPVKAAEGSATDSKASASASDSSVHSTTADPVSGKAKTPREPSAEELAHLARVLKPDDLVDVFFDMRRQLCNYFATNPTPASLADRDWHNGRITIGLVGYPNVGKSSTINALCGVKRVAVTSTPGKTKHLQTINLSETMTLCDCPGLVFPSFLGSKAEMVCNGVLPVDQASDYLSPVELLCHRIPHHVLASHFCMPDFDESVRAATSDPTANDTTVAMHFLSAFARSRGFVTARGIPAHSQAARLVLKDYVTGGLVYGHPPPGVPSEDYQRVAKAQPPPMPERDEKREAEAAARRRAEAAQGWGTAHMSGRHKGNQAYTRTEFLHSPVSLTSSGRRSRK
eukprot:TRINITY_DN5303_c0_g1_i1.p1 TRINITY_DN5303_c0_g1~~TRINITY_DN5303_c0_g1_i1.p1  ORF type:complete len:662 (-),score=175.90 TRINITY_DN5303_c0_g1_i1:26-1990(-)